MTFQRMGRKQNDPGYEYSIWLDDGGGKGRWDDWLPCSGRAIRSLGSSAILAEVRSGTLVELTVEGITRRFRCTLDKETA